MHVLNKYTEEKCKTDTDPKEEIIKQVADHKYQSMTYPIAMAYYSQNMDLSEISVALCWGAFIYIFLIIIERLSCKIIGAKPKKP